MNSFDLSPRHELSYLAGLIDGEGWIGVQKSGRHYKPNLAVNMTDRRGVELARSHFGGTVALKEWPPHLNYKPQHCWRVCGNTAVEAVRKLEPYLLLKRAQAHEVMRSKWERFNGRGIPDKERELRHSVWENLRALNRKGKE